MHFRESSKIVEEKLLEIGKSISECLPVSAVQGTVELSSNPAMMQVEDLQPVDGTIDCHKLVSVKVVVEQCVCSCPNQNNFVGQIL